MLRIAEARYKCGWTQEQLAAAIESTQATVQRWETGQVVPQVSRLEDISKAMGISLSFILGLDEHEQRHELSELESELLDIMRTITPEGQKQLMIYARGIASTYSKSNQVKSA